MCKKQTAVSHSSTESEIVSLDTGLRLDGILALDSWDLIVSVLGNTIQTPERPGRPVIIDKSQRSQGKTNVLNNIDCVPSNVQSSHQEALLYVFEDNEAVIKMIIPITTKNVTASKKISELFAVIGTHHRRLVELIFDCSSSVSCSQNYF